MNFGRLNNLKVVRHSSPGMYLDTGDGTEILLPGAEIPTGLQLGQVVEVFIYRDSEDRLIATTRTPYIMVGHCACLKVVDVNKVGAFLDWGLPKDLLVPFSQQARRMETGKSYVVTAYVDKHSGRVVASSRLSRWLQETGAEFRVGQTVDLLVAVRTDLGWKAVINQTHLGLIFHGDVACPLKPGYTTKGLIKRIRSEDQRIDLAITPKQIKSTRRLAEEIVNFLKAQGGRSTLSDHASPERILKTFGVSKSTYKKTLGLLYRERRILIADDEIVLVGKADSSRLRREKKSSKIAEGVRHPVSGKVGEAKNPSVRRKKSKTGGASRTKDKRSGVYESSRPPKQRLSKANRNRSRSKGKPDSFGSGKGGH